MRWRDERLARPAVGRPGGDARHSTIKFLLRGVLDPTAADDDVTVVEDGGLAGGDGALRLVKGNSDFVRPGGFNNGWCRLMLVADLHGDPHGLAQLGHRNQVHPASAESARVKLLV